MQSYDYMKREGVKETSWGDFGELAASLVSHSWADPAPDITALVRDALVIFPWDREVYMDGKWRPHPEIIAALQAQSQSGSV